MSIPGSCMVKPFLHRNGDFWVLKDGRINAIVDRALFPLLGVQFQSNSFSGHEQYCDSGNCYESS